MDDKEKRDLEEVIREETGRGRRRIDFDARRERAQLLRDFRKHLALSTEEEFVNAMRAFGLRDGSPELSEVLRIWRGYRP
jgi:hypothetical protein